VKPIFKDHETKLWVWNKGHKLEAITMFNPTNTRSGKVLYVRKSNFLTIEKFVERYGRQPE
jgi:hypothetical protein